MEIQTKSFDVYFWHRTIYPRLSFQRIFVHWLKFLYNTLLDYVIDFTNQLNLAALFEDSRI